MDLLHGMTNPSNLQVVVGKMVEFLKASTDEVLRTDLMKKIFDLSERFVFSFFFRLCCRVLLVLCVLCTCCVSACVQCVARLWPTPTSSHSCRGLP